jgi:hypothetical protein
MGLAKKHKRTPKTTASSRAAARAISSSAKRVARATRKASKVAMTLGKEARKAAKGGRVEVTIMSKALGEAPEKYHFVLHDGRRIKSLYELVDELETMSDETFRRYANEMRNDFANWVRDVFDEKVLAEDIARMQQRMDAQRTILKHLVRDLRKVVSMKK